MSIPWSQEQLMKANQKLMDENARLRKALGFYAKKETHDFEIDLSTSDIEVKSEILEDYGEIARKALESESE